MCPTVRSTRLPLSAVKISAGTQSRAAICKATLADYAEAMLNGSNFPPIVVFRHGNEILLADGFHRVRAAKLAKLDSILAEVRPGNRIDALKFSLSSNHSHGLRRTNEDKRHGVTLALNAFKNWSDRAVAEMVGVSQPMVGAVRRQLIKTISCERRVGRDGRSRKLPVGTKRTVMALPPEPTTSDDQRAQSRLSEIAHKLAEVQSDIEAMVNLFPNQIPVLEGFISKVRNDLLFLNKRLKK